MNRNMNRYHPVAILLVVAGVLGAAGVAVGQAPPSNVTRYTSRADVVPQEGPQELHQLIIDFVPGAASSIHYHSGTAHTTVLAGTITVRYADREQVVGTGDSWTDAPGEVHQALNLGSEPAVVAVTFVQPKGAMVTVPVDALQSPGPALR